MKHLFKPYSLAHLNVKNRLVRSATQDYFGTKDGFVTDRQIELVRNIVQHDVGMFITSHVCVNARGRANFLQNCFYDDCFIAGQAKIAETIQKYGAKAILQISHAGCSAVANNLEKPLSPSGVPYFFGTRPTPVVVDGEKSPASMTLADIKQLKADFVAAAIRAQKAGFDGIQIHFAHSYLISQFLNPLYNLRSDQYGGSKENRLRIGLEIIEAIKNALGKEYPLFIKINSNIEENDAAFEKDFFYYMEQLDTAGLEGIEISGWDFTPLGKAGQKNYFLERASQVAARIKTPVILVGGARNLTDAAQILATNIAMLSMARPFICEPDVSTKIKNDLTSRCISCSKCFTIYFKEGRVCVFHST